MRETPMKACEPAPAGPWRQVRAIALLPGIVTVAVPAAILIVGDGPQIGWGLDGAAAVPPVLAGLTLIAAGLVLWVWTVRLLARIGKGTLAPWDPTRRLVVAGPYRYVRNPMISAVLCVLLGEAVMFGSPALLIWFAAFFAINWVGFLVYEEPGLVRRFGGEYREFRRNVPRWLPRRTPWTPAGQGPGLADREPRRPSSGTH
jgi:protein-S-isoprenylcysteine O-methyltransferase Ste14